MSESSQKIRYVRTNREIAKAVGIALPKQRLKRLEKISEINGWRALADFPKFVKGKGYPQLEVIVWSEGYAQRVAPEKQRRAAVAEILGGEKPGSRAVRALSTVHSPQSTVENAAGARRQNEGNPGPVPSQNAMSGELQERYGLPIKRQTIQRWIHGVHLPVGAPRFPAPDPMRAGWNDPSRCYAWYEQWVIGPMEAARTGGSAGGAVQMDLIGQKAADAQVAEYDKAIESAAIEKLKREALEREISEKWILRDSARATAMQAVNEILHVVETEYEKNAPVRRREKLQSLMSTVHSPQSGAGDSGVLALVEEFCAWDAEDERARIDRIRVGCGKRGNLTTDGHR